MIKFKKNNTYLIIIISLIAVLLSSCGLYKKTDQSIPQNALERAKKMWKKEEELVLED